jgi:hypothetical protein
MSFMIRVEKLLNLKPPTGYNLTVNISGFACDGYGYWARCENRGSTDLQSFTDESGFAEFDHDSRNYDKVTITVR